jgi:putative CRISPR-associated protein, csn1 family
MENDYRNTIYCEPLNNIQYKKNTVKQLVLSEHPKAIDLHSYISDNNEKYKVEFMKAYNYKCAYCGVSIELIPKDLFEVDHYIYQKSERFKTKKEAGYIDNLVLSCHNCNHNKSSFNIEESFYDDLYPDNTKICDFFYRDDLYYIKLTESGLKHNRVSLFYNKLKFYSEIHRLDFLLMNLIGLSSKHQLNQDDQIKLYSIIEILRMKRNLK